MLTAHLEEVQVRCVLLTEVGNEYALGDGHDGVWLFGNILWPGIRRGCTTNHRSNVDMSWTALSYRIAKNGHAACMCAFSLLSIECISSFRTEMLDTANRSVLTVGCEQQASVQGRMVD